MFSIFSKKNSNNVVQGKAMDFSTEVDPIAEAEVYWSYGREAKAKEILDEAYANGDFALKSRIDKYLSEKGGSLQKIPMQENFQYRVHCVQYVNGYTEAHKFFINCKYPKNSKNGIEEIENYIERNLFKSGTNWTISFISEKLD